MEHIYFEVQLCINISNSKEISNIHILIILALGTSQSKTMHGSITADKEHILRKSARCPGTILRLAFHPL